MDLLRHLTLAHTNTIQVASDGVTNYAFWSEFATDTPPLQQYPSPPVTYSKDKAYVSLVYGDMDNIAFVESFGASHMEIRSQRCTNATGAPRQMQ